jgi:hypothetical protein
MAEEKNGPSGFRVVDRRSFSSDGEPREGARRDAPKPQTPPPVRQPADTPQPEPEPPDEFSAEPAGFDTLVSYLSTTAMFQLGALAGPGGERIPADLPNARRTIDLLETLQQKTQGNLSPEEARFLDDALYELRLAYLEVEKRQTHRVK